MRRVWPARNVGRMGNTGLLNVEREAADVAEEGRVFTSVTFVHEAASPTPNESGRALPNPARLSDEALDENIMAFHRSEGRAKARIQADNRGRQSARKLVRGGIRARSAGLNFRGMILAEREDVFNTMARQYDREAVREEHVYNFLRMNLSRYVRPRPLGQLFGGREPNHDGFPYWNEDFE